MSVPRAAITMVIAATVPIALAAGVAQSAKEASAYRAPRTHDGKPNFSGIWQALNTANWDIEPHAAQQGPKQFGALFSIPGGAGVVEGGEIPYKPDALKKRDENARKRWTDDPEAKCYLPGVPRIVYLPFPFQIVQSSNYIMMASEYASATRTLHLAIHKRPFADTWMGHSNAQFDGESLVVDVSGLNGEAWLDRAGNFVSANAHIVERFTFTGPGRLAYEVQIDDPSVFIRPWKMSMPLYLRSEPGAQLVEFKCVEFSEDLLYGYLRRQPGQ